MQRRNGYIQIGKTFLLVLLGFAFLLCTSCVGVSAGKNVAEAHFDDTGSGCGKVPPFAPGTSMDQQIDVGGMTRTYLLHIPLNYQNSVAQPLVLNFHGHSSTSFVQEHITGMSQLANHYDFVVAYPQGTIGMDHHTGWNTGPRNYPHVNDIGFASTLITHLQSTLCINSNRVYAMGFSNGGGMTNVLACSLSNRIAAFAIVSGGMHPVAGGCHTSRPVSLLEIHGTADTVVPYKGNALNDHEPPIVEWLHGWATRDHCVGTPSVFLQRNGVMGEQWTKCEDGASIMHYRISHEGHIWPTVAFQLNARQSLQASGLIWQFFQNHTLHNTRMPARVDVSVSHVASHRGRR